MNKLILEHEVEELARLVLGLDDDIDDCEIEDYLFNKFEVSFEQFQQIASALIMFTNPFKEDGENHYCFVKECGNKDFVKAVARIIVKQDGEP